MPLISAIRHRFTLPGLSQKPFFNFIEKRSGPFSGSVELTRERVYILPTRSGLIFALLILILLVGSINYSKSLGFALTFLLTGIGNVALYSCWRNLAGLRLKSGASANVFCGETACFSVQLENTDSSPRHAIAISQHGIEGEYTDVPALASAILSLPVKSRQRGRLYAGKFRLASEYPAGLFVAWTWIDLSMQCLVYPTPAAAVNMPSAPDDAGNDSGQNCTGSDEYSHLKKFKPGDNWRRICWKTAAKSDIFYSRQFTGGTPKPRWISWFDLDAESTEVKLSMMTRLVLDAHKQQQPYGLILPDSRLPPATGQSHYQHCLRRLALFQKTTDTGNS